MLTRLHSCIQCLAALHKLFAEWLRQSVKPTGLKSIYWWDGKVQKDDELLLVMKTQTALLQQLVEAVKKHQPANHRRQPIIPQVDS